MERRAKTVLNEPVRPRFTLFRDIAQDIDKEFVVQDLMGIGESGCTYGKPGDGKSVLIQDGGMHVAAGMRWFGRETKQGLVIYFALERHKLVERRALAFKKEQRLTDIPFVIVAGVYDFRDPKIVTNVQTIIAEAEAATEQKCVLLIVDTLSRALCSGDENSPKDMGALVHATSVIQAGGPYVKWIHHVPHDAERMRGHGAMMGAIDLGLSVVKADDGVRVATVVKGSDIEEGQQLCFRLKSVSLGRNKRGHEIFAPAVVPIERTTIAVKAAKRMPKSAAIALRALNDAIIDHGTKPPPTDRIPAGINVVTREFWQAHALRFGVSPDNSQKVRNQTFKRAAEWLIATNRVGCWDGHVWPI
jgi:hypothetical protein